jgi:hypothetical protein
LALRFSRTFISPFSTSVSSMAAMMPAVVRAVPSASRFSPPLVELATLATLPGRYGYERLSS